MDILAAVPRQVRIEDAGGTAHKIFRLSMVKEGTGCTEKITDIIVANMPALFPCHRNTTSFYCTRICILPLVAKDYALVVEQWCTSNAEIISFKRSVAFRFGSINTQIRFRV